jgi:hypothetical protein
MSKTVSPNVRFMRHSKIGSQVYASWHLRGTPFLTQVCPSSRLPTIVQDGSRSLVMAVVDSDCVYPRWRSRRVGEIVPHLTLLPRMVWLMVSALTCGGRVGRFRIFNCAYRKRPNEGSTLCASRFLATLGSIPSNPRLGKILCCLSNENMVTPPVRARNNRPT